MGFVERVRALLESQGTAKHVARALEELELEYVDDVPEQIEDYFLRRCAALEQESRS